MGTKPAAMLWELIGRLANINLTIRISGETGVGKEAIARLLFNHYPQNDGSFKRFDCRDLGRGSQRKRPHGWPAKALNDFDRAMAAPENQVFYLEHIESLPTNLQTRLHAMLDRHYPNAPPWVFVSSIEPLEQYQRNNQIHEQLFEDLNTIHIALPPLRARPDRIPQILSWLLNQAASGSAAGLMPMPDMQSMQRLVHYHWPGNWRQLQQVALEALHSKTWQATIDSLEDIKTGNKTNISTMAAIHILSSAKLNIRKERVMDGLMASSCLEEVGLLDLAIFIEAVSQIADHLSAADEEDGTGGPTSNS